MAFGDLFDYNTGGGMPTTPQVAPQGLLGGSAPAMGGLLSPPTQQAPQALAPPVIHKPGVNPVLGVLDALLLGGAGRQIQNANYNTHLQNAQAAYQQQAISAYASTLTPEELALFRSDPKGYLETQEFNRKQMDVAGGHSVYRQGAPNGGGVYTAPLVGYDQSRGVGTAVAGNGALSVGAAPGVMQSATTDAAGNITDYTGHRVGTAPVPQKLSPTERLEYSGGASGTGVIGGPPAGAPMLSPDQTGASAPRGIRNNNYTNLTALPGGQQWAGQTGVDKGGYVQFATPQDGINAAVKNLHSYATAHGINTVAGLVQRWAPAGSGNNTAAYTGFVAKQLGVGPNDKIDLTDPATTHKVIGALAAFENGPKAFAKGAPTPDIAASAPRIGGGTFDPNNPKGIPAAMKAGPISPADMEKLGYGKGTVGNREADGTVKVTQTPQTVGNISKDDQARVAQLLKDADQEQKVAKMSHDFMVMNGKTATGLGFAPMEVPIPFAHSEINVNPTHAIGRQLDPNVPAMESLTSRAAPMLRPQGSGRIMGQEYGNFLQAFPNIKNPGEGNQKINSQLQDEASTLSAQADFLSGWLKQHGNLQGADAAFRAKYPHGLGHGPQIGSPAGAPKKGRVLNYNPTTGGFD